MRRDMGSGSLRGMLAMGRLHRHMRIPLRRVHIMLLFGIITLEDIE